MSSAPADSSTTFEPKCSAYAQHTMGSMYVLAPFKLNFMIYAQPLFSLINTCVRGQFYSLCTKWGLVLQRSVWIVHELNAVGSLYLYVLILSKSNNQNLSGKF